MASEALVAGNLLLAMKFVLSKVEAWDVGYQCKGIICSLPSCSFAYVNKRGRVYKPTHAFCRLVEGGGECFCHRNLRIVLIIETTRLHVLRMDDDGESRKRTVRVHPHPRS